MLREHLLKQAGYNCWANEKCSAFVLAAGEEIADRPLESSFPTIRKTLYHIWDAEIVWLKRLNRQTLESWPPSAQYTGTLAQGVKDFLRNSESFKNHIASLSESDMTASISYENTSGAAFHSRISDMLAHCLNHSTYHRGQVITMLRQAGFTAVSSTDFITWCRKNS